jgi:SnoaL-like protein
MSIEDRLEIHELVALHGHLADDRRAEDLGLLMTEDGVYDLEEFGLGEVVGLPAMTELFASAPGNQPIGHHVTNVLVTPRGADRADVRSKGLSVMADGAAGTVVYEDTVVRTPAGWRISRRKVVTRS